MKPNVFDLCREWWKHERGGCLLTSICGSDCSEFGPFLKAQAAPMPVDFPSYMRLRAENDRLRHDVETLGRELREARSSWLAAMKRVTPLTEESLAATLRCNRLLEQELSATNRELARVARRALSTGQQVNYLRAELTAMKRHYCRGKALTCPRQHQPEKDCVWNEGCAAAVAGVLSDHEVKCLRAELASMKRHYCSIKTLTCPRDCVWTEGCAAAEKPA